MMPTYIVKARAIIDIETTFDYAEDDSGIPGADTLKVCIDEDIADSENAGHGICGAINDCQIINFQCVKEG